METRVVHFKKEKCDVYIGRPSKWGNPFSHIPAGTKAQFVVATRYEAIEAYRNWIMTQPQLLASLPELEGKVLGCWCKPKSCHGDVLVQLVNELKNTQKNEDSID
jgi:hypothetical protein